VLKLNSLFSQYFQAYSGSLLNELLNFGLNFLNFKRFEKNVQNRLMNTGLQAFIMNRNEQKSIHKEERLNDYLLKKTFICKAKTFDSMAKLAKAHKKWIKAVQTELQKYKKMLAFFI